MKIQDGLLLKQKLIPRLFEKIVKIQWSFYPVVLLIPSCQSKLKMLKNILCVCDI